MKLPGFSLVAPVHVTGCGCCRWQLGNQMLAVICWLRCNAHIHIHWCAVCLSAHVVMCGEMLCARHAPGVQRALCFLLTCHFRRQGAIGVVRVTARIHELVFQPCGDRMERAHAYGVALSHGLIVSVSGGLSCRIVVCCVLECTCSHVW